MPQKYEVALTDERRGEWQALLRQGGLSFRQHRRVRTLLLADVGETDAELESHTSSSEGPRPPGKRSGTPSPRPVAGASASPTRE